MKTIKVLGACVVLALGSLAFCESPDEGADTILVVGDFLNPPFSSWNDAHEAVGIEVEMLALVGEALGRPVEWRELPFAEMLPAVAKGEAHIAASTIGIRPTSTNVS